MDLPNSHPGDTTGKRGRRGLHRGAGAKLAGCLGVFVLGAVLTPDVLVAGGVAPVKTIARSQAETLTEAWTREYGTFRDGSISGKERLAAILRGYQRCDAWIRTHPAPFKAAQQAQLGAMREAMAAAEQLANGYLDGAFVAQVHRAWFKSVVAHCADGTHEQVFVEELASRVRFVLRHGSVEELELLLTDQVLARIERAGSKDPIRQQRVIRADARRTRGAFRESLEDLAIAKAQLERGPGQGASDGRGAYEAVAVKVAIDLGLLDRASASLGELRKLADNKEPGSFEDQRYRLALARYFQANGQFQRVVAVADQLLPSGADPSSLQLNLDDAQARALLLRAIALSKLAQTAEERSEAVQAIRLEKERAATDKASRIPLDIELAAFLIGSDAAAHREEALSLTVSVLSALESGSSSALFTARAAAQLYSLVEGIGSEQDIERARRLLESSAAKLVRSWRDIGRVDGGIGFLDFPERLAVASTWIESRLDSPGGAEFALEGLLEIDRCSQLAQRLSERWPASPAHTVQVEDFVAAAKEHGAVLVWFLPAPDRTHRFVIGPSGVEYAALAPLTAFKGPMERVGHWLRRRPGEGEGEGNAAGPKVQGDLRWLADELLPRFLIHGASDPTSNRGTPPLPSLWLAGLDPFGHAPMEVLPSASGTAIGLMVPVVRMPSVTCAMHGALAPPDEGSEGQKGTFAVFSPPMKDHPQGDIALRIDEINALREAGLGHARFSLTRGPAGTRQGFANALRSRAELFVAWTHGRYDFSLDRPAGLAAAGPSEEGFDFLDAAFVEMILASSAQRVIPRAVYLAACDVARGHRRVGDAGASHLAGAFLGAGVPAVVASGERNDREATAFHLEAFSRAYLRDGHGAGQSMLKARRWVAAQPGFQHPHFWAGLQLLGWGPTSRR